MRRGLWIGDGGVPTGFSTVNTNIIENLPAKEYDIHHLAVNYQGDWIETKPWHKLYPAYLGGDYMGIQRVNSMIDSIKPDFIFILNDPWIIKDYVQYLPPEIPTIFYFPVDAGPLQPAWVEALSRAHKIVAYTKFGRNEVLKVDPELDVDIMPHGIDHSHFFPIPKPAACKMMGTVDPNHWIVLNANRNQPRKRVDLTIKGFVEFAKDKPANVKLYLHMGLMDSHIRIDRMINRYKDNRGELFGTRLYITDIQAKLQSVPVERLNLIYNCCEFGINTSMGEGWGLVPWEHAATGSPQLVSNNSASAELFGEERGYLIPVQEETITTPNILTEGSVPSVTSIAEALQYAYDNPEDMQERAQAMQEYIKQPKFEWSNIALRWHEMIQGLFK